MTTQNSQPGNAPVHHFVTHSVAVRDPSTIDMFEGMDEPQKTSPTAPKSKHAELLDSMHQRMTQARSGASVDASNPGTSAVKKFAPRKPVDPMQGLDRSAPAAAKKPAAAKAKAEKPETVNASSVIAKAKNTAALMFYDKQAGVRLFRGKSTSAKAPVLSGSIGDQNVVLFLRQKNDGVFMGVLSKNADGSFTNLGTANMVSNYSGYPRLLIKLAGKDQIWSTAMRAADDALLQKLGLDVEHMMLKRIKLDEAERAFV